MAPLQRELLLVPKHLIFEDTLTHRKHTGVTHNPLDAKDRVVITYEARPVSNPFPDGKPFQTKLEGTIVKTLMVPVDSEGIAMLNQEWESKGHRVVPLFEGHNITGPFRGAYIVKPFTKAMEASVREALLKEFDGG